MAAKLGAQVAILEAGRVVLIQRDDFHVWALPGGSIDPGEDAASAAVREAYEETGLEVRLQRCVGLYHTLPNDEHIVLFTAQIAGGALQRQTNETRDAGFFTPDALPQPLLWPHLRRIADSFAGVCGAQWQQHFYLPPGLPPFDPQAGLYSNLIALRDNKQGGPATLLEILTRPGTEQAIFAGNQL